MKLRGFAFVVFTFYSVVCTPCKLDCVTEWIFLHLFLKEDSNHTPKSNKERHLPVVFSKRPNKADNKVDLRRKNWKV